MKTIKLLFLSVSLILSVSASAQLTFNNGLHKTDHTVKLGGDLTENTIIGNGIGNNFDIFLGSYDFPILSTVGGMKAVDIGNNFVDNASGDLLRLRTLSAAIGTFYYINGVNVASEKVQSNGRIEVLQHGTSGNGFIYNSDSGELLRLIDGTLTLGKYLVYPQIPIDSTGLPPNTIYRTGNVLMIKN